MRCAGEPSPGYYSVRDGPAKGVKLFVDVEPQHQLRPGADAYSFPPGPWGSMASGGPYWAYCAPVRRDTSWPDLFECFLRPSPRTCDCSPGEGISSQAPKHRSRCCSSPGAPWVVDSWPRRTRSDDESRMVEVGPPSVPRKDLRGGGATARIDRAAVSRNQGNGGRSAPWKHTSETSLSTRPLIFYPPRRYGGRPGAVGGGLVGYTQWLTRTKLGG